MNRVVYLAADAAVYAGNGVLHSVSLTGGSDAATLTLKHGGSSGSTILVLKAAANTVIERVFPGGIFVTDLYAAFTGTSPSATFEV